MQMAVQFGFKTKNYFWHNSMDHRLWCISHFFWLLWIIKCSDTFRLPWQLSKLSDLRRNFPTSLVFLQRSVFFPTLGLQFTRFSHLNLYFVWTRHFPEKNLDDFCPPLVESGVWLWQWGQLDFVRCLVYDSHLIISRSFGLKQCNGSDRNRDISAFINNVCFVTFIMIGIKWEKLYFEQWRYCIFLRFWSLFLLVHYHLLVQKTLWCMLLQDNASNHWLSQHCIRFFPVQRIFSSRQI